MKKLIETLIFILTGKNDAYVNEGLIDLSGQGRNRYGN